MWNFESVMDERNRNMIEYILTRNVRLGSCRIVYDEFHECGQREDALKWTVPVFPSL